MKRLLSSILFLLLAAAAATALASEPSPRKIRVLLTYGGHGFEEKPFFALFDAMRGIKYTKAEMPKDAGLLKPGLEKKYDVLVMYDMMSMKPEQETDFIALLKQGIGVVALHHNMGAHPNWDEFRKIIGGKFLLKDCEIDGKAFKKSGWDHDQDLRIFVADKEHPITRGVSDFEIHDETYSGYYVEPGVHVLLKTDHPKNTPELAWTTHYGRSPVFYLMLGHDGQAYRNPNYAKLVQQGIRWAAKGK
jgi:uncharacterized protein